ncbi:MAG: transport-associated domain protein [Pirellula sp.]|nr:transport-associated domain protein [Pirellula sp.]
MVCEEARSLLSNGMYCEVRDMDVCTDGRRLILRGCVRTFYFKQLAQELLRNFARANRLRIENMMTVLEQPSA